MENLKEVINGKYGKSDYKLENIYQKKYDSDETFRRIANEIDLPTTTMMKYTTKFEQATLEYTHCMNCPNIMECKNEVEGYCFYPEKNNEDIAFSYRPCKYKIALDEKNQQLKNIYYFEMPKDIKEASMKNIDTKDKNRFDVIKSIKEYLTNDKNNKEQKGFYLNGSFGCGKTYLISAMLQEIAKTGKTISIIYYPEFIRSLKESFGDSEEYKRKFNQIKHSEYLLLDDIGAENVTEWSRDEVLGPLLQYRMDSHLKTFFTSNLTLEELEEHLSTTHKDVDMVKSRRIIERIKQLSNSMTLISANKRK